MEAAKTALCNDYVITAYPLIDSSERGVEVYILLVKVLTQVGLLHFVVVLMFVVFVNFVTEYVPGRS